MALEIDRSFLYWYAFGLVEIFFIQIDVRKKLFVFLYFLIKSSKMTSEEKVKYWIELSDEDFRVAKGFYIKTQELQQWTKENILLTK